MGSPYSMPAPYRPLYGEAIIDLLRQRGDIQAQAGMQRAAIWNNALNQIGQIAAGAVQQHQEEKQQKAQAAALSSYVDSGIWQADPQAGLAGAVKILGPQRGIQFFQGLATLQKPQYDQKDLEFALKAAKVAKDTMGPEAFTQDYYPRLVQGYGQKFQAAGVTLPPAEQAAQYVDHWHEQLSGAKPETGFTLGPGQTRFGPQGEQIAAVAPTPKEPKQYQVTVPGPNGPVTRLATEEEMKAGVREYQKPPASLVVNPQTESDRKELAESVVNGTMLPSMLSRRSADYNRTLADANRISKETTGKPFNFAKAQLDYEAGKRFVGSMNGNQMIRFKGLAGSVVNTIDEVRALAQELKQGGVQKWNQVKRDTVMQVYGNTPQSALAARYVSAVNTLKEEFANLAQGGYAPTDAAWKLADQQINGNYGLRDFDASLTEAQRLINYRLGAFDELGPTLIGGGGQTFVGAETGGKQKDDPMGIR